ncbi:MAG: sugar ABC transporter ATP-binding protein [Oscillospiraceae bacterium]|nr:sugar ABC transporter ATP-binding protein [Oscillospiraceae bacterium]
MSEYILEMKNISKNYGGVQALKNVDLRLAPGEVLCLVGENGAGKSTLMKILTGVEHQTAGDIFLKGKRVSINKPIDAYRLGISIVHQELVQIPDLSIAENIFLGRYKKHLGVIDYKALNASTVALMDKLGIHFNPNSKIKKHSVAERQLIEILKALSYDSNIVVFDEPTAALTLDETEVLYGIIRKMKAEGRSIIFISHRMDDIFAVGDRVMVLRDGENSGDQPIENLDVNKIINMMIGREMKGYFIDKTNTPGETILEVRHLNNASVEDVSFELRRGEVLGFGGLIGSGRTEVLRAIFGIDPYEGEVLLNGQVIHNKTPEEAIKRGFSFVPEDRKDQGLILEHSVLQNTVLSILDVLSRFGVASHRKEVAVGKKYVSELSIKTASLSTKAKMLSGGNQQKIVLAKALASNPGIILLDEPTRGVDVGAKSEIYKIINDLACKGFAILMVSSELPELLAVSDRIVVMHEGKVSGTVDAKTATEQSIMEMAI